MQRRDGDQQSLGTQINEKSLRLVARGLEVGDRAEAYLRFPGGAQNALGYRQLRVWMRGRGPGWEEGDLQAFIKVGSDDRNFYLYRAPARSTTWEPEFLIDLEAWRRLRGRARGRAGSTATAGREPPCGVPDPTAYVACEGPYLVHLRDPGDQSAEPRRDPGDLRRDLPGRRRRCADRGRAVGRRHPAEQSGLRAGHGAVARRPAGRVATSATSRSPTCGRTANSGRSTRTRPTAPPGRSSSTPDGSSTGSCPPRSACRCRSTSPTPAAAVHPELLTGTDLRETRSPGCGGRSSEHPELQPHHPPEQARAPTSSPRRWSTRSPCGRR